MEPHKVILAPPAQNPKWLCLTNTMKNWFLAIACLMASGLAIPSHLQAQSGPPQYWYGAATVSDPGCNASGYCASLADACNALFNGPNLISPSSYVDPIHSGGWCRVYDVATSSYLAPNFMPPTCPTGTVVDVNTPSGCVPSGDAQPPKDIGSCHAGGASCGDPIDVGSGNVFEKATDYQTSGQNVLEFRRFYNSRGTVSGILGTNWRSNYDRYIRIYGSGGTVGFGAERSDGQVLLFTKSGSSYVPDSDVDVTLTNSGSTWTLTEHDDTVETYTTTSVGDEALLNTITARNGYTQTLTYNGRNQLTSVTDSYGRTITLSVNGDGLLSSITTPDSTTIGYAYNGSGPFARLTTVTFPTSPATSVTYNYANTSVPSAVTGVTDENGNAYKTWTYDAYGRGLTSQLGSGANQTTVVYSSPANPTVTNALGVTDTYTFTTLQNVPKVTGISRAVTSTTAAATEAFGYDTNGYRNSFTDWNGNQTTFVNNTHGMPTTINEAVGTSVARTTTIAYDSTCVHLPDSTTTSGLTANFTYDSSCDVLTSTLTDTTTQSIPYSTNGQTRTTTYTYSNFLLATVKNPNGNTTTFGHDSTGALTSITDALSHVTNITSHTGGGLPETIVDPNSVTTTLTYSPRQWLLSSAVSGPDGTFTTNWQYDSAGNMIKKTLPDNSYLAPSYDTAHRVIKITDALGDYATLTLDALGDVTAYGAYPSSGGSPWSSHSDSYDALGRTLVDTGGRSQTVTRAYDANGNITTVKDGFGNATTNVFDPLNRLSTSTDPNSGVATITYDAYGRDTNVKDANSNSTAYVYNGFGDAIQQASPDSGTTVFKYDGDRNLTQRTDAVGNVMNAAYDALDRNTSLQYPGDTTKDVWKTYDQTGSNHGSSIGRLTSVADTAGCCYAIGYDERGNVHFAQRTIGSSYSTLWQGYDNAGRPSGFTYPSGIYVGYLRDAQGRVNEVYLNTVGSSTNQVVAWIGNAPFGPMDYITYGNNVYGAYHLDADYSISNIQQQNSSATYLQNITYTLDNNNNVTGISDAVNAANGQTLGYDIISRLTSAVSGTSGYGSYGWTLDKVGNRLSQTFGSTTTNYSYTSGTNRLSAIGSTSVTTNADGNITSIPPANSGTPATLAYGADGRLTSVTGSPIGATFVTDFMGERFSKTEPGSHPTYYTYGMDGALLEETNNGTTIDYIYADGRPIAMFLPTSGGTSGTMYYIHDDRIGQPQFVTNSSQSVVWSTTYQPHGSSGLITGSITQNLRFPGQYFDVETGFNYNHFRDYMPNLGRYLESDPIGIKGGLNPFLYAGANPLKFFDRAGLQENGPITPLPVEEVSSTDMESSLWNTGTISANRIGELQEDQQDAYENGQSLASGFDLATQMAQQLANIFSNSGNQNMTQVPYTPIWPYADYLPSGIGEGNSWGFCTPANIYGTPSSGDGTSLSNLEQ